MALTDWRRWLVDVVLVLSRSMDRDSPDGPLFTPSDNDLERLEALVSELKVGTSACCNDEEIRAVMLHVSPTEIPVNFYEVNEQLTAE